MKTKLATIRISILLLAIVLPMMMQAASVNDVLARTSQKLSAAPSLVAKFTGTAAGTLTVSGKRFAMVTPDFAIWYNGTDMWSYSKPSGETSLTTPTRSELLESNPMEIIKNYKSVFNASKVSEKGGKMTIKLTPKSASNSVKQATVVINTATSLPERIDVTFSSGEKMAFNITSITEGGSVAAGTFVYPAAKYAGVEVIDLR